MRLFTLGLLMFAAIAGAQQKDCGAEQSSRGQESCLGDRLADAEQRLQKTWAEVLKETDPADLDPRMPEERPWRIRFRRSLLASQRAWLVYRRRECAAERAQFEGGTIAPVEELACRVELTEKRTKLLRDIYLSNK